MLRVQPADSAVTTGNRQEKPACCNAGVCSGTHSTAQKGPANSVPRPKRQLTSADPQVSQGQRRPPMQRSPRLRRTQACRAGGPPSSVRHRRRRPHPRDEARARIPDPAPVRPMTASPSSSTVSSPSPRASAMASDHFVGLGGGQESPRPGAAAGGMAPSTPVHRERSSAGMQVDPCRAVHNALTRVSSSYSARRTSARNVPRSAYCPRTAQRR